jgi:hypothetical protein
MQNDFWIYALDMTKMLNPFPFGWDGGYSLKATDFVLMILDFV